VERRTTYLGIFRSSSNLSTLLIEHPHRLCFCLPRWFGLRSFESYNDFLLLCYFSRYSVLIFAFASVRVQYCPLVSALLFSTNPVFSGYFSLCHSSVSDLIPLLSLNFSFLWFLHRIGVDIGFDFDFTILNILPVHRLKLMVTLTALCLENYFWLLFLGLT